MTLSAYTQRASPGDGDCKSPHRNRAAPDSSFAVASTCPTTRKERACFAAECGLDRLGHTWTPHGLEQAHEKNGPVLLQNVAPRPFWAHTSTRGSIF